MFKNRQLISLFLLSLYLVVFLHNSIPHTHHNGTHDFSIALNSDSESILVSLGDVIDELAHDSGDEHHLAHIFVQTQSFSSDKVLFVSLFNSVLELYKMELEEKEKLRPFRDDGGTSLYQAYLSSSGLRAPPVLG